MGKLSEHFSEEEIQKISKYMKKNVQHLAIREIQIKLQ